MPTCTVHVLMCCQFKSDDNEFLHSLGRVSDTNGDRRANVHLRCGLEEEVVGTVLTPGHGCGRLNCHSENTAVMSARTRRQGHTGKLLRSATGIVQRLVGVDLRRGCLHAPCLKPRLAKWQAGRAYLAVGLEGEDKVAVGLVVQHQGRDTADGGRVGPRQVEDHLVVESAVAVPEAWVRARHGDKRLSNPKQ